MYVQITKGYKALIDDEDADLACLKWYATAIRWGPYAMRDAKMVKGVRGKKISMHRLIADRMGLPREEGLQVDHINGNTLDNRRSNIRVVTCAENSRNQKDRTENTSGFKGVHWDKSRGKWMAFISLPTGFKNIGRFDTFEEAVAARLRVEVAEWGVVPQRAHLHK